MRLCVCASVRVCAFVRSCMCVSLCACVRACVRACGCARIPTRVHTFRPTHAHSLLDGSMRVEDDEHNVFEAHVGEGMAGEVDVNLAGVGD